jgi:feruloyl-CoA synthase
MASVASEQSSKAHARPVRAVRLAAPDHIVERRRDGGILIRARARLASYPDRLTDRLLHWAEKTPDRVFMAAREANGEWRSISYAETLRLTRAIGQALLARDLSPERPIVILSGNGLEHALLGLASVYVGLPYAPISPAYSLISTDFGKLRHIINLLTPGLVFAADGNAFAPAIEAVVPPDAEIVVTRKPIASRSTTLFDDLIKTEATTAVDAAHDTVGPDTIAKFLFTSGSTGAPKAVINTQRMWCANQVMIRTALTYFQDEPPVIVDWAPWHHTAGGNHDVGLVLYNGGTFYIDEGKPLPGAIEKTVRNLREVAPTWYFNVPKGFEALLPYLRDDETLRRNFFSKLKVLWFAGAGIGQHVFDEMKQLALDACGEEILFLTGFGATETAPYALGRTWAAENAANMGLPAAGMELKLVPSEGKLEASVRGPNITPGYWRQPELTAQAFDEEGFYKLGDAFKFADPDDPAKGLLFDGRLTEDFKLATGTWVSVGPLRLKFLEHFVPFVRDVVIAGDRRDDIAAIVFPDVHACRHLAPDLDPECPPDVVLSDVRVRSEFRFLLTALARESTGSSNRICRAILAAEPPSLDRGEITDKGSINQRAVLQHRARLVEALYAEPCAADVIAIEDKELRQ